MRLTGIDEAGYGPLLGPLTVAAITVEAADPAAAEALRALGADDSKRIHDSADLAPLEAVALPLAGWLLGRMPATYAELLASMVAESPAGRRWPWQAGAEALALPAARHAAPLAAWAPAGLAPVRAAVAALHPEHLNACRGAGINRAAAELAAVQAHIAAAAAAPGAIAVDRLGGRTRYRDLLMAARPGALVLIEREEPAAACYRLGGPDGDVAVSFRVGADAASPLVGAASCLAKYVRELDMLLLNRHFAGRPGGAALRPTAGYPLDAKRWLAQAAIAPGESTALVRHGAAGAAEMGSRAERAHG